MSNIIASDNLDLTYLEPIKVELEDPFIAKAAPPVK